MQGAGTEDFLVLFVHARPTPIPRGTGFLARDQVLGMGPWVPRRRKNNLKIPVCLPIVEIQNHVFEQDLGSQLANVCKKSTPSLSLSTLSNGELSALAGQCGGLRPKWGEHRVFSAHWLSHGMFKARNIDQGPFVMKGGLHIRIPLSRPVQSLVSASLTMYLLSPPASLCPSSSSGPHVTPNVYHHSQASMTSGLCSP